MNLRKDHYQKTHELTANECLTWLLCSPRLSLGDGYRMSRLSVNLLSVFGALKIKYLCVRGSETVASRQSPSAW